MSYDEHLISMAGGDGDTVDQLAAIEARSNAATEGPWAVDELGNVEDVPELDLHRFDIMPQTIARTELRKEDGEFIAHARTDVPALLALVREQQAKLDRVEQACADAERYINGGPLAGVGGAVWVSTSNIRAAITATEEGK